MLLLVEEEVVGVADSDVELVQRLHSVIVSRSQKNQVRERFVRGKQRLLESGVSIPAGMREFQIPMDWPRKAVDVFASRLQAAGYSNRVDSPVGKFLEDVFAENDFDLIESQVIRAAVQYGCAFVFSEPDVSLPSGMRLRAASPHEATALYGPDGGLKAALRKVDEGTVDLYAPGFIQRFTLESLGGWVPSGPKRLTGSRRVLCAPYVHEWQIDRPFGASRITETVMAATYAATRTLLRQEVAAEFYSAPRSVLLGADKSVFSEESAWSAVLGAVWGLPDVSWEDDQDMPDALRRADLKQIPQMSMQPFSDQYRLLASVVSGATSIPLHYLGVVQDSNPTSAEAIEAHEIDMTNAVRGQQASLGRGRRALALDVVSCTERRFTVDEVRYLRPRWIDPRTRSLSEQSQFVALQVQAGNMQPGTEATLRQLPLSEEERVEIVRENRGAFDSRAVAALIAQEPPTEAVEDRAVVDGAEEIAGTAVFD